MAFGPHNPGGKPVNGLLCNNQENIWLRLQGSALALSVKMYPLYAG